MLNNIRISARIAIGFGILIALLAITTLLGYTAGIRERNEIDALVSNQVTSGFAAADMLYRSMLLRRYEKDLIINLQDPAKVDEYKSKWDESLARFNDAKATALKLADDDEKAHIQQFEQAMAAYTAGFGKIHQGVKRSTYPGPADANKAMGEFKQPIHEMEKGISEFQQQQLKHAQDKAGATVLGAQLSARTTLILGVIAIVIGLLAAWLIARSITRPLVQMQSTMTRIEHSGDLTQRIGYQSGDEIGLASRAFNSLIESMRTVLSEAQHSANLLRHASQDLNIASEQVAQASGLQAEAAASTAAAVEQMTVSINVVADNARSVEHDAMNGRTLSDDGMRLASDTAREINQIADAISGSATVIGSLSERSREIGGIVHVIKDIADQTNLLALNAAIEAARAGEQGRGFAVVADEVRKLAERTTQATAEISRMIDAVQHDTSSAVNSMQSASDKVGMGVSLTQQVSSSLTEINHFTVGTASMMADISTAISEQSSASTQIAQNVEKIAQMSEENNGAIRQTASLANELKATAHTLDALVRRFQIGAA
ncbi:methyl-accepting chemotaxis protein [Chitinivorax sp. PXF-14]|uniref:methyl-accepting chemotaxis protein n=1 Tax=Chitinivorax sp. PXF-14 TaxID=3230488 RepID=UPI0034650E4E